MDEDGYQIYMTESTACEQVLMYMSSQCEPPPYENADSYPLHFGGVLSNATVYFGTNEYTYENLSIKRYLLAFNNLDTDERWYFICWSSNLISICLQKLGSHSDTKGLIFTLILHSIFFCLLFLTQQINFQKKRRTCKKCRLNNNQLTKVIKLCLILVQSFSSLKSYHCQITPFFINSVFLFVYFHLFLSKILTYTTKKTTLFMN